MLRIGSSMGATTLKIMTFSIIISKIRHSWQSIVMLNVTYKSVVVLNVIVLSVVTILIVGNQERNLENKLGT